MSTRIESGPFAGLTLLGREAVLVPPPARPRRGLDLSVAEVADRPAPPPQAANRDERLRAQALAPRGDTGPWRMSVGVRHGVFDMNNFRGSPSSYTTASVRRDLGGGVSVGLQAESVDVAIHDYGSLPARGRKEVQTLMVVARYEAGRPEAVARPFVEAGVGAHRSSTHVTARARDYFPGDRALEAARLRIEGDTMAPAAEVGAGVSVRLAPGVHAELYGSVRESLRDSVPVYLDLADGSTRRVPAAHGGALLQEGNFRMYAGGLRLTVTR